MIALKAGPMPSRYYRGWLPPVPLSYSQMRVSREIRRLLHENKLRLQPQNCLCGKQGGVVLASRDRFNIPSRTVVCERCGLIRVDPRMTDDSLYVFYTHHYQALYQGEENFEALFEAQVRHGEVIADFTGLGCKPKRVLEVGTGPGGILKAFAGLGHEALGVELDPKAVAWGNARGGFTIHQGDVGAFSDQTGTADLVILSHVLEHLAQPSEVLRSIHRLLGENGLLYIEVPGVRSLESGQQGMCGSTAAHPHNKDFLEYLRSVHLWSFELRTLRAVVEACGFEMIRGDELARGLFKKSKQATASSWGVHQGRAVLEFLQKLEGERRSHDVRHIVRDGRAWGRTFASWLAKSLGVR